MKKISIESRAKINIFLKVYGTRPDGFHEIQSVFQSIDLADTIKFSLEKGRAGITIRTTHKDLPLGSDNLIVRAFERLVKFKEPPAGQGVLCEITKKIPIGAGLGGGSSNCASALIVLNSLLDIDLDIKKLSAIGSELGSDVPFFFTGGTSFVYGRGEKIEMLPEISRCGFIIAVPPLKVDTKTAYDYLDKNREITGSMSSESPMPNETRQLWSDAILNNNFAPYMCNDFEETVIKYYPEIEKAKKRLENLSGTVLMSGSGSAVFAYFPDYNDAWKALENYEPLTGEFLYIASPVKEGYIING